MALTPEQKRRQRQRQRARARRERQQARLNPLNAPFKTPAQLRAEAQRMAELSVTPEETLREEQRKQEAGLGAVTGTAAGVLGGYQQQVAGGLGGLASMYQNLAGQARSAGGEALAAAGVSPSDVPAASATVPAQFANLAALTSGYVPAAVATGQRLIGESKQGLSRALAERSSALSQNMAKFLQDLQQREYEKAVAQEINRQNMSRLGLQQQQIAADVAMDEANLALRQQTVAQGWARIEQAAANAVLRAQERAEEANEDKRQQRLKGIKAAKDSLLKDRAKLTSASQRGTGTFKYDVEFFNTNDGRVDKVTVPSATSPQDAINQARNRIAGNADPNSFSAIRGKENMETRPAKKRDVLMFAVPILREAGMTRKAAIRWVTKNIIPFLGPLEATENTSGIFTGGVGGG